MWILFLGQGNRETRRLPPPQLLVHLDELEDSTSIF